MRLLFYLDSIIGIKDFAYFCGVKPSNYGNDNIKV